MAVIWRIIDDLSTYFMLANRNKISYPKLEKPSRKGNIS